MINSIDNKPLDTNEEQFEIFEKFTEKFPSGDNNPSFFSSSSDASFWQEVNRVVGKTGEGIRLKNLSEVFRERYGLHWSDTETISELHFFSKYERYLNEMEAQKAFTKRYITGVFELEPSNGTFRRLIQILVKRELLKTIEWHGKARGTFGVTIYITPNATTEDIRTTLIEYESADRLRYGKQLQRQAERREVEDKPLNVKESLRKKAAEREIRKIGKQITELSTSKTLRHRTIQIDPSGSSYETLCDCFERNKEWCAKIISVDSDIVKYKRKIMATLRKEPANVTKILYLKYQEELDLA